MAIMSPLFRMSTCIILTIISYAVFKEFFSPAMLVHLVPLASVTNLFLIMATKAHLNKLNSNLIQWETIERRNLESDKLSLDHKIGIRKNKTELGNLSTFSLLFSVGIFIYWAQKSYSPLVEMQLIVGSYFVTAVALSVFVEARDISNMIDKSVSKFKRI